MSVVILVALTLQGLAAFEIRIGPIERPPFMWPFLDYPMYTRARYAGDALERQVVVGILEDSTESIIAPDDLGVTFWQFQNFLNPAILSGDRALARAYKSIYEERFGGSLLAFRLENHPLTMTDEGLREAPPVVLGSLFFEPN